MGMTPDVLARNGDEDGIQAAVFAYTAVAQMWGWELADQWAAGGVLPGKWDGIERVPELRWYYAIPNGGYRGSNRKDAMIRGARMKATGTRAGVADTFLPVPRGEWHGLYIELKKPGGRLSAEQEEFGEWVKAQGYGWVMCDGWRACVDILRSYLEC